MPFDTPGSYTFTKGSITSNAPNQSGVYGLYTPAHWVYIGEADDIQRRLLEHLAEKDTCIGRLGPSAFVFELSAPDARVARQRGLIGECRPACNQAAGRA